MSSVLKATIHAPRFVAGARDAARDVVVVWHKHLPLGHGVTSEYPGYTVEVREEGIEHAEVLDRANHAAPALRCATREAIKLWDEADDACQAWAKQLRATKGGA